MAELSLILPFPALTTRADARRAAFAAMMELVVDSVPQCVETLTITVDVRWALLSNPLDVLPSETWARIDQSLSSKRVRTFDLILKVSWKLHTPSAPADAPERLRATIAESVVASLPLCHGTHDRKHVLKRT